MVWRKIGALSDLGRDLHGEVGSSSSVSSMTREWLLGLLFVQISSSEELSALSLPTTSTRRLKRLRLGSNRW